MIPKNDKSPLSRHRLCPLIRTIIFKSVINMYNYYLKISTLFLFASK